MAPQPKLALMAKPKHWGKKLVTGAILGGFGLYGLFSYSHFEMHAVHTKGAVLRLLHENAHTGRRGGVITSYRPVVRFTLPNTHEIEATATGASTRFDFDAGAQVDIAYNPNNPENTMRIETGVSIFDIGLSISGVLFILAGINDVWQWQKFKGLANVAPARLQQHS